MNHVLISLAADWVRRVSVHNSHVVAVCVDMTIERSAILRHSDFAASRAMSHCYYYRNGKDKQTDKKGKYGVLGTSVNNWKIIRLFIF